MKIILATHNQHKIAEIATIMHGTGWQFNSLNDIGYHDEIIEDGITLKENAWVKADIIHSLTGKNVIAEDTGLEVDSLDGAPGVHSARYAGGHRNDSDNINKLLTNLIDRARTAQFRTIVACIINGQRYQCEGIIRGSIATSRMGAGGFGYDPVFIPEGYDISFGMLSSDIKNTISHRARAFQQCKNLLLKIAFP